MCWRDSASRVQNVSVCFVRLPVLIVFFCPLLLLFLCLVSLCPIACNKCRPTSMTASHKPPIDTWANHIISGAQVSEQATNETRSASPKSSCALFEKASATNRANRYSFFSPIALFLLFNRSQGSTLKSLMINDRNGERESERETQRDS